MLVQVSWQPGLSCQSPAWHHWYLIMISVDTPCFISVSQSTQTRAMTTTLPKSTVSSTVHCSYCPSQANCETNFGNYTEIMQWQFYFNSSLCEGFIIVNNLKLNSLLWMYSLSSSDMFSAVLKTVISCFLMWSGKWF